MAGRRGERNTIGRGGQFEPQLEIGVVSPRSAVQLLRRVGLQHVLGQSVEDVKESLELELAQVASFECWRVEIVAHRKAELRFSHRVGCV